MVRREPASKLEYLIVARVRRSHGVRGEVLVAIDTDRPKQVFRSGRTLLLGDAEAIPTGRQVVLENTRLVTGGAILKLAGVDNRDEADALRGRSLLIPAAEAQPAAADEVHHRDLVGLTAVAAGEKLGIVDDIVEFGAGELLVVRHPTGKEMLIPLVPDIVREVDLPSGELRLQLPEGFLEI